CCGLAMLWLCVTVQPSILTGVRVNAASSPGASASSGDLIDRAQQLYQSGNYPQAIELLKQAIDTYRTDPLKQAMGWSNLALVYQQLGDWQAANNAIDRSLKLLQNRSIPGRSGILAQTLEIQGQLQFAQGQTEAALTTWEQTAQLYTQIGDDAGITRSQINQCHALRVLGFYRRAQTILEKLKVSLVSKPDTTIKVVTLRSLGIALEQSGDVERAGTVLEQSLTIAKKLKLDNEINATHLILGNLARTKQQVPKAIDYYSLAATSTTNLVSIQARLNLLSLQIEAKQNTEAEQLIVPIQQQLATLPPNRTKFNAQINFAQSLSKLNRRSLAAQVLAETIQQSKNLDDRQRTQSLALGTLGELYKQQEQWQDAEDATSRALTLVASANADDLAYRWYGQLGYVLAKQNKDKQAIESYSAAIDTLKLLRKDLVDVNRDLQFTFKESIEPTYRELVGLLLKPSNQNSSGKNLERARNLIEDLQVAELDNFFREACLNNSKVIIDEVVDRENPNAAIIYPIILENELQVIVKIPGQKILKQHRVAKTRQAVEKDLQQLQDWLLEPDRNKDIQRLSQEVYSWLVAPFESEFNGKINTLVFVLDGSFRNVPMSVLYDGKQYLIEKNYAIGTNLGLSLQSSKPISRSTLNILAVGLAKPSKQFANIFSDLPEVPSQMKAIRDTGVMMTELKDDKFTIQAFGEQVKDIPYNVIHLATHGQFSSQIDKTFLLANDGELKLVEFDKLLRDRAQTQRNPIELLVMSACETAVGDNRATLGLAGVAVKAGAQSTLASLWKVKDSSTAVLMGEFYRELKTGKVSKAEALRRAQIKLLKEYSNYSAPLYWAPFILVGNWL
ncbi:CHAT domain-containing protein, partial [Chamaesiphon sp. VAR_48_metabat_135_sub]|uniref:CHAT domain-containing protein n=1 Tax=Chamaesiphon sp. VAR_48_metabat_135_sub TaxID=2964699 RepID=UPI00286A910E